MEYTDAKELTTHSKVGKHYKQGNDMMMMEKWNEKLMWERPMFNQDRAGDYRPGRLSKDMLDLRSQETIAYGCRRMGDTRKFKGAKSIEFPDAIQRMNDRIKREEEEKSADKGPKLRMRWWWKKTAVELRDPLKMLRFNNFQFRPEDLMSTKDIVFLQLTGCRLGDDAMSWVSAFMQQSYTLKRICLQANNITEEGCNELFLGLRTTKTLMEFDISMNPIGDDGVATLCNALSENSRWSKVYTVNFSCCKLGPSAAYHLARLIRDFKPLQALLAWRNNLGCPTPMKVGGVASILEELRATTTMKLINLTANVISDADAAFHANAREIEMRRRSTLETEKKQLAFKVEELQKEIRRRRREAVWDDQRVEIAGMEKELETFRSQLRVAASLEARSRTKAQREEQAYQDRVRQSTGGQELISVRTKPRLILTGNHAIRRVTLSRLSAFYDIAAAPDTYEFVHRRRRFDNLIHYRRQLGEEYVERKDLNAFDDFNVFPWELSFDPNVDHARRTVFVDWRQEQHDKLMNAKAVKFEKFSLQAPTDAPVGKDGKKMKLVAGGFKVASGVMDNIRDETEHDRAKKKAGNVHVIANPDGEPTKGTVKSKVHIEREVETEIVRVAADGKTTTTKTHSKASLKDREEKEVDREEFKRLESSKNIPLQSSKDIQHETKVVSSSSTTTTATSKDKSLSSDALPAPRVVSSSSTTLKTSSVEEEGEEEDEYEQNDAEGFDFDNVDEDADGGDLVAALLGRAAEQEAEEAQRKREIEQRALEQRQKLEKKLKTTPRNEAPTHLVVARPDDVADQLAGSVLAGSSKLNSSRPGVVSARSGGNWSSNPNSARGGGGAPSSTAGEEDGPVIEPTSPLITDAKAKSVMEVVQQSVTRTSTDGAPLTKVPSTVGGASPAGSLATSTSGGAAAAPPVVPVIPTVNANELPKETETVMDIFSSIRKSKEKIRELSEKGSPSDADLANLEKEKVALGKIKTDGASTISAFSAAAVIGSAQLNDAWDFIDDLIRDTDIPAGNAELLAALLLKVATDYPTLIEERGLAAMAAADSSISYLKLLLAVPDLRLDAVDLISCCFFNQTHRIPLSALVLAQPSNIVDLSSVVDEVSFMWQEFFEDIASKKKAIPREDRTGRMELLSVMISNSDYELDIEAEGGDGQSIVFRAAAEGDFELMSLLLAHKQLKDPNAARSAGMTVFHAAVVGNDVDLVKLLLEKVPELDIKLASENGNGLDLATSLGRDPAIVAFLKEKGLKPTGKAPKAGGKKSKSKSVAGKSSKPAPKRPASKK